MYSSIDVMCARLLCFPVFVEEFDVARLCTVDSPPFLLSNSVEPHLYKLVIVGVIAGFGAVGVVGLFYQLVRDSSNVILCLIYMEYV